MLNNICKELFLKTLKSNCEIYNIDSDENLW